MPRLSRALNPAATWYLPGVRFAPLVLAVVGVIAACDREPPTTAILTASASPALEPAIPGVVAKLGRGACYGACPVYEVTIHEDGRVEYHGSKFVVTEGSAEGRVSSDEVVNLRRAFERARFFEVPPLPRGMSSAGPSEDFVYYAAAGRGRRLDLPTGCDGTPVEKAVTDLRSELDRIVDIEKWIGTPEARKRFGSGYAH
jgi:hypothetical protein